MTKLIALAAIATMLMLAASPPASASYWHYGGRCRRCAGSTVPVV
jgi:hypothetical protein